MNLKNITERFAVAGQIAPDDLAAIKELGIKSIVINRPDGEIEGQAPAAEIIQLAADLGMQAAYVPYQSGQNPLEVLPAFAQQMANLPEPTLAYCRSGTRSTVLWALSQKGKQPAEAILQAAQAAGYDLSAYRDFLQMAE